MHVRHLFLLLLLIPLLPAHAQEVIELETTTIKGNTELPKYLYVVPWQNSKSKAGGDRKLKLPNLYGEYFDPLMPAPLAAAHEMGAPAMPD